MKSVLVLLVCLLSIISSSSAAIITKANTDYTLYVDDASGLFTVSGQVGGSEVPILFGADSTDPTPLTSFITIYSQHADSQYITGLYNSQDDQHTVDPDKSTNYIQPVSIDSSASDTIKLTYEVANEFHAVVSLVLVTPSGSTGLSSQIQSSVLIETEITSLCATESTYLVNYILDYRLDTDDGPTFRAISDASARQHMARAYTSPKFDYYMLESNKPIETAYTIVGTVNVPDQYLLEKTTPKFTPKVDVSSSIYDLYGYMFTIAPKYLTFTSMDQAYHLAWSITTFTYKGKDHEFSTSVSQGLEFKHRGVYDPTAPYDDAGVVHTWEFKLKKDAKDTAEASFFVKTSKDNYIGDQATQTCSDKYECTYDYFVDVDCNDSECINLPIHQYCNDGNLCTVDICDQSTVFDPKTGCAHIMKNCDDEIPCTRDWCNPLTGLCENDASAAGFAVSCDDHNSCTKDFCDDSDLGKCINEPNDDLCAVAGDKCQHHYCDARPGKGCATRDVDCDDQVWCTDDSCDPVKGCVNDPVHTHCDDKIDCTVDVCDAKVGKCMNYPTNSLCDDQDPCTTDLCDVHKGKCVHIPMECNMNDLECTLDYCINGYCLHLADDAQCNDGVACTDDHCNLRLSECTNKPNDAYCDDGKFCTKDYCDPVSGCKHDQVECDDGIPCSVDSCDATKDTCVHDFSKEHVICDDGIACTNDVCSKDLAKCIHQTIDILCDDADPCTVDRCDPHSGCIHERTYCNDDNPCTIDSCDSTGECVFSYDTPASAAICDDKVACTADTCDPNVGCINIPYDYMCNDNVECTDDVCTGANCTNTPNDFNCDDGIPCTIDHCDAVVGCVHTAVNEICDDGLVFTDEYCDTYLGCRFSLNDSQCAIYTGTVGATCKVAYATYTGCEFYEFPGACDDKINCTVDSCGADGRCVNLPMDSMCSDDVGCTDDACVPGVGCVHNANAGHCSDGFDCTVETCDELYGCVIDTALCPVETGKESCINCRSPRSRIGVATYEDEDGTVTADFKIQTRAAPVVPFTTVSTEGLTDNMVITRTGSIVFGKEEYLENGPAVVIGADSGLRLVPSKEEYLPRCNEVSRGMMVVQQSQNKAGDFVDHMYVCLKETDREDFNKESYTWVRYI